ncbi:MAG: PD40 domain-containing protein [Bacteroidales bacterium]|nr:PD40 domain-containing protein [Bacteroidales bacterium]
MRKRYLNTSLITLVLLAICQIAGSQTTVDRLIAKADSARLAYDFILADELCRQVTELDSTAVDKIEDLSIMSKNGQKMMEFCSRPVVVTRRTFPLKDFLLFYPLEDNSWRESPNQLDPNGGDGLAQAVFYPEGAKDIYYSAADDEGIRNIYRTSLADSMWTAPTLINEQLTSSSDEIYPMLSPDGESMYFASKGLYGVGGYDLYVSKWNPETGDWDVPVNMGFPYSSPYDDFLFMNTEDGRYSIFASNRSCSKDSVCVYVIEYDGMPVREAILDVKDLRALSALFPARDPGRIEKSNEDDTGEEAKRYMEKMKEVRSLRDSVSNFNKGLEALRSEYSSASDDRKAALAEEILAKELQLPSINDSLQKAVKGLQALEMEFLANGIVLDVKKLQERADNEVARRPSSVRFTRHSYGPAPSLAIREPEKKFDYSFMILPEGRFAENNKLPNGIIYQIQMFTQSRKATIADIKGLSPVFERQSGGKYICSVGLFRTYADALANLNKVKKQGFRTAEIRAYKDGEQISVNNARKLENERLYTVVFYPVNGQSLPDGAMEAFRKAGTDVAKSVENGSVVFKAGPFHDKGEAEELMRALKALDAGDCKISDE